MGGRAACQHPQAARGGLKSPRRSLGRAPILHKIDWVALRPAHTAARLRARAVQRTMKRGMRIVRLWAGSRAEIATDEVVHSARCATPHAGGDDVQGSHGLGTIWAGRRF